MSQQTPEQLEVKNEVRQLLATAEGRRFLVRLIYGNDGCDLEGKSFTGNSETFYREGRRAIGRELREQLAEHQPELWRTALLENMEVLQ